MTTPDPQPTEALSSRTAQSSTPLDLSERERLAFALSQRFAPHVEAAATAVREAEQSLAQAREHLSRAREAEAGQGYRSDRLVFMRAAVNDEVEGLARKTTPKKVRVAYRYLLDRAVELAAGEVQEYTSDQDSAQHAREHSVEACSRPSVRPANGWKRPMPCTVASRTRNTLPARDLPSWSRS